MIKIITEKVQKTWGSHEKFSLDKFNENKFNIVHYAGEVSYDVDQWLNKNQDPLTADSEKTMYASKNKFISNMFEPTLKKKKEQNFFLLHKNIKNNLIN